MYLLNMSYLRHNTVVEPAHEAAGLPLQAHVACDQLDKAAYFDANFSPLPQTLTDNPGSGKSAAVTSCSMRCWSGTRVRGCWRTTRMARMAIGDVVKLVPSLVRFTNKYWEKEFSKSEFAVSCLFLC
jgi:exocyst complex protein 7